MVTRPWPDLRSLLLASGLLQVCLLGRMYSAVKLWIVLFSRLPTATLLISRAARQSLVRWLVIMATSLAATEMRLQRRAQDLSLVFLTGQVC